jgi:hypothetical protein
VLPKYIIGVPCWTRLLLQHNGTKLHDNRPAREWGGNPCGPYLPTAMDPGSRRDKNTNGGRETLPGGPQGGRILLEN